jgi:dihydroorotate dehydrogenase
MIVLSNGHKLDVACGAGALSFDGRGWPWEYPLRWTGLIRPDELTVVAKTVTLHPKAGNLRWWCPWRCVRLIPSGAVNAVSLTNRGIAHWVFRSYPKAKELGYEIAASVQPTNEQEAQEMGEMLAPLDLAYVEFNYSCPNADHPVTDAKALIDKLTLKSGHPLLVKLSYDQAIDKRFVEMLDEHNKVEGVHAINAVPWRYVYPGHVSPLKKHVLLDGGVSGSPIFGYTCRAVRSLRDTTRLPIIAGGGISALSHMLKLEALGASAFSIGTLFLRRPWEPRELIRRYRKHKESSHASKERRLAQAEIHRQYDRADSD